jgi:hypothetical protein
LKKIKIKTDLGARKQVLAERGEKRIFARNSINEKYKRKKRENAKDVKVEFKKRRKENWREKRMHVRSCMNVNCDCLSVD